MKKSSRLLLLLFFFYTSINQALSQNNGILFEIKGKNLKGSSYLFGTFPLSNKNKFAFDNGVFKYIDQCDKVTTEIDFINGFKELADSAGLADFNYRLMARLFNSNINEVYLPVFSTLDDAEKSLLSLMSTGGSSLTQLENMYASRLGIKSDFDQWQWPNLKVMQYAVKKKKNYSGMQPIDSFVNAYTDFIKLHESFPEQIAKSLKNIPSDQQQNILKQIPNYIATGKSDNLYSLLKHMKDGSDTLILQIFNIRAAYLTAKFQEMMKEQRVFSAVNWFTLTNPKGILQQLRDLGYTVKAVKMKSNPEAMYATVKALPYETTFNQVKSNDGFLEFIFPGQCTNIQSGPYLNNWAYYDMVNKASFSVSRIKHNYTFKGKTIGYILKKTDSLLYEKVPGVIEKKELIENEFYTGYDIVSFNRKDDYMHMKFYITPYEFVFVKCEGSGRFAVQTSADKFFESVKLNTGMLKPQAEPVVFSNSFYSSKVPGFVSTFNPKGFYHSFSESFDQQHNVDLIYIKGTYHSSDYLDEDTFLLNTCVNRFVENLDLKEKNRSYGNNSVVVNFVDAVDTRYYTVKAIRYGIYYYIVAASYPDSIGTIASKYIDQFVPQNNIEYPPFKMIEDTTLHFSVLSPEIAFEEPHSRATQMIQRISKIGKNSRYVKSQKKHSYTCFSTGETINTALSIYDEYTYFPDSVGFWKIITDNAGANYEYKISRQKAESKSGYQSLSFLLTDTNTTAGIKVKVVLKGRALFVVSAGIDTTQAESSFITSFFNSFEPKNDSTFEGSIFKQQIDKYLDALISNDSATVAKALNIFPWYTFNSTHLDRLGNMLKQIPAKKEETELLAVKDRIMDIYGSIKDSLSTDFLKQWYAEVGDTSDLQVRLLSTMARQKTPYAMKVIKELLTDNPPAAKNTNQLGFFFSTLEDSAKLSASLIPDLLPLLTNEDFKEYFLGFLAYLSDSNFIEPKLLEPKLGEIILQAKNELKRQNSSETGEDKTTAYNASLVYYTKILLPYYGTNEEVKSFIDKCLSSTVLSLRQDIAYYMLKHNKLVPDSIWESLAKIDWQRYSLIIDLQSLNHLEKLPAQYRLQSQYARALACNEVIYSIGKDKYKSEDLVYLDKRKVYFHQQWGYVYLFKVKSNGYNYESNENSDSWKLIISGMQPSDTSKVNLNTNLTYAASAVLDENKSIDEQFDTLLRAIINARRHTKYTSYKPTYDEVTDYDYSSYDGD